MVSVSPSVGLVETIAPPPEVLSFVTAQPIQPVLVDGEVMVGATLPAAVPVYSIPASPVCSSPTSTAEGRDRARSKKDRLRGAVKSDDGDTLADGMSGFGI